MSWAAPAYPPALTHRSPRSRSPARGSYPPRPPYPDSGYPQDPYRADWDAYDRDRAWANYERERAAYEYSRRGRSRSPSADENGRKRRRSMSPYDRDRYDPRPRYNDDFDTHSRGHGYGSPRRGQYPGGYSSSRRPPPDPRTFDYPSSLKQYAEWFRYYYPQQAIEEDNADKAAELEAGDGSKPRNGIKTRWENYKKELAAHQLQTMFDHHRKSPWFAEKYDPIPEMQALRARVRKDGWNGRIDAFLRDLESGLYDPNTNEPESVVEPTSSASLVKENVTNGEEAGGGNSVRDDEVKPTVGDDEMHFAMETEEDRDVSRPEANGKPSSDSRGSRGDEVSVAPEGNQVMIRTIPPDIGRLRLEEACSKVHGYIHLALGDPLQKRNYYRAGWLKFADSADMASVISELSEIKVEGFKLHVTHNTRPFVSRVRYTPESASKPDRLEKDLTQAKALAAFLEAEAATLWSPTDESNLTSLLQDNIKAENADDAKDPRMEEESITKTGPDVKEESLRPAGSGSEAVERRIEKIMADLRDQGLVDATTYDAKKILVSLDLYLSYLRSAYHTCYYCALVTDHLEELQRKCLKHVRKPISKKLSEEVGAEVEKVEKVKQEKEGDTEKTKEVPSRENRDWKRNDERWLEWLDSKIAVLINRDNVDPRDYGGKSYDEQLTRLVEPFIKQEDEGKFRCKTCQKLFKATPFVEKHIANKHPELVKSLEEIPYFNNFALDPHRIQPFAHPPQGTGNSQPPPPQAYGIQGPVYQGEYGRSGGFYSGSYAPGYPPYPGNGVYWDHYGYQYGSAPYPPPPRRDEATTARRLSDRISGYAPSYDQPRESMVPPSAGLPPKPVGIPEPGLSAGGRTRARGASVTAAAPPPPPDAKEDPRAAAGKKVSYHDMDLVAEGDVELTY